MKRQPLFSLLAVVGVAVVLGAAFLFTRGLPGPAPAPATLPPAAALPATLPPSPAATATLAAPTQTPAPTYTPSPAPTPTRVVREWEWVKPGFSGLDVPPLTKGIEQYSFYTWSPNCDAPARRHIPMIWGRQNFYTDTVALQNLFDGLCNDGRPLLFLNEPAKVEQANISPVEAASMFYTMTRGADWPYERWHGPIYAGNNVVEERHWDAEFVRAFAKLNGGSTVIPEIAGWGIHLYANYEYGDKMGDGSILYTGDIPSGEIKPVVYRSMHQVDAYAAERRAEGNATAFVVTEFGLLQASQWHTPRTYYYDTTARFMDEYVRQFDRRPEIKAWYWYISTGAKDDFLDTNHAVDWQGKLTPNGVKWRELAGARQR